MVISMRIYICIYICIYTHILTHSEDKPPENISKGVLTKSKLSTTLYYFYFLKGGEKTMTPYVKTDLTVDTVNLRWTYYKTDFNSTVRHGWIYNPPKKEGRAYSYYKKVNDVALIYIPLWNEFMVSFSASKLANGCNAFPYTNNQYEIVKEKVEQAIQSELGHPL